MKENIPEPPKEEFSYKVDDLTTIETIIAAPFKDVYFMVIDIMNRVKWMNGLTNISEGDDHAFVGSLHTCVFEDFKAIISPVQTRVNKDEVIYVEKMIVDELKLQLIYEYRFRPNDSKGCQLDCRVVSIADKPLDEEMHYYLFENLRKSCNKLKAYCEQGVNAPV
jgi:hypothetical protein